MNAAEVPPCAKCGFGKLAHEPPFACSNHAYEPSKICTLCDFDTWATRSHQEACARRKKPE